MTLTEPFRYDQSSDVKMRLVGTIVKYKGEPVYVSSMSRNVPLGVVVVPISKMTMSHYHGESVKGTEVHSSDEDLDLSPIKLGWMNMEPFCVYFYKTPRNSQRQGIVLQNLESLILSSKGQYGGGLEITGDAAFKDFNTMLEGQYKPFLSVLKRVADGTVKAEAFDIDWAMCKRGHFYGIYHKTVPVALFKPETKTFMFRRGAMTKTRLTSLNYILYKDNPTASFQMTEVNN